MPRSLKRIIQDAEAELAHLETPRLDAEILLASVLSCEREYLYKNPGLKIDQHQAERFHKLINKRAHLYPVAYMLGKKEFWSMVLSVNGSTLIPRPETEVLVECALKNIPDDDGIDVLDIGTGTGAVAMCIAKERPLSRIIAVDIDSSVLLVAKDNIKAHRLSNIRCIQSDIFSSLEGMTFHMIVSNPPYIASLDQAFISGEIMHEPRIALDGGEEGLDSIKNIIDNAKNHLNESAMLIIEHGYDQGSRVRELFMQNNYSLVNTIQDYSGLDRVTSGRLNA